MPMMQPITARIASAAYNLYLNNEISKIYPRCPGLGVLQAYRRISYNNGGTEVHWFPRFRRRSIEANVGDQVALSFIAVNTRLEARLPWRHYSLTERIGRHERKVAKNQKQLSMIVERITKEALQDFEFDFKRKIYANANAAGSLDIAGLGTYTQPGSMISTSNTPCADGNGTYAGYSLVLGALGGTWTGYWPIGSGDAEYSAWTPILISATAEFWSTSADERKWSASWQKQLRFAKTYLQMLTDTDPKVVLLTPEMLRVAADSLSMYYRLEVTAKSPIVDLGIRSLNFDGMELVADSACTSGVAYVFDPANFELMCLGSQLVERAEDTDITTQTELIRFDFDGQLVTYTPAAVAAIFNATT